MLEGGKQFADYIVSKIADQQPLDIQYVDYIALCPGYTTRLLFNNPEENGTPKITDTNLIDKITDHKKSQKFREKYGYSNPAYIPDAYYVENAEFKFWQLGLNVSGEPNGREKGDNVKDSPIYLMEYEDQEDFDPNDLDLKPEATPIMIQHYCWFYLFEQCAYNIIDSFYPKHQDDLRGSIIFKGDTGKLELNDWLRLAECIDIDFCACYSPTSPYKQKIIRNNGITILVVKFDCESG